MSSSSFVSDESFSLSNTRGLGCDHCRQVLLPVDVQTQLTRSPEQALQSRKPAERDSPAPTNRIRRIHFFYRSASHEALTDRFGLIYAPGGSS